MQACEVVRACQWILHQAELHSRSGASTAPHRNGVLELPIVPDWMQAMTSAAGLPSMLDREELIGQTMRLRSQHAELQQRAEASRKVKQSSVPDVISP